MSKIIEYQKLTLKNFLSYGNVPTVIILNKPGLTLIIGENKDQYVNNGKSANGVGKTTIINALSFVCFDKAVSNISKNKLQNNINEKLEMEVSLEFKSNDNQYRIVRTRKRSSGNVSIYENGIDITPDSIGNTNEKIEEILGISFDIFCRTVIFSTKQSSFLELPPKSQIETIEQLFNLSILSDKAEQIKERIKGTKQSIEVEKTKISMIEQQNQRIQKQIEQTKLKIEDWENNRKSSILTIYKDLNSINDIDIDYQKKLHEDKLSLKRELSELERNHKLLSNNKQNILKTIQKLDNELKTLEKNECPYCHQMFKDTEEHKTKCDSDIKNNLESLEIINNGLDEITSNVSSVGERLENISNDIIGDFEKINNIATNKTKLETKLEDLVNQQNPFIDSLEQLQKSEVSDINYTTINALNDDLKHEEFLYKLLTKKDSFIRRNIIDSNLAFINNRIQSYVIDMGLPHVVKFDDTLSINISLQGRQYDYGQFSSGERARVNIAISLSFRDVLKQTSSVMNLCIFDEVLDDGLDESGVNYAIQILKNKAKSENSSFFVISHKQTDTNIADNVLTVRKVNRFSEIV